MTKSEERRIDCQAHGESLCDNINPCEDCLRNPDRTNENTGRKCVDYNCKHCEQTTEVRPEMKENRRRPEQLDTITVSRNDMEDILLTFLSRNANFIAEQVREIFIAYPAKKHVPFDEKNGGYHE